MALLDSGSSSRFVTSSVLGSSAVLCIFSHQRIYISPPWLTKRGGTVSACECEYSHGRFSMLSSHGFSLLLSGLCPLRLGR